MGSKCTGAGAPRKREALLHDREVYQRFYGDEEVNLCPAMRTLTCTYEPSPAMWALTCLVDPHLPCGPLTCTYEPSPAMWALTFHANPGLIQLQVKGGVKGGGE